MNEEYKMSELNVGKKYRYYESDIGCTIFAEILIRELSYYGEQYELYAEILKDLGSDPKLDLDEFMGDNLTLVYTKGFEHYFKGRFYNPV